MSKGFKCDKTRVQVLSYGGGTQSTAIAVLIYQKKLPKPDIVVMSDTTRESSVVMPYFKEHVVPLLDDMSIDWVVPSADEYSDTNVFIGGNSLPPFFSERGQKLRPALSRQPGFCSGKWKTDVIRRYLNSRFGEAKYEQWMGITVDEIRRAKTPIGKWQKLYPLLALRLNRQECIKLVEDFGLPSPPRSSCWMCPNHHDSEWRHIKENIPEDFDRAVKFERELRKIDGDLWLNARGLPLDEIDFDEVGGQGDLFRCDGGVCFT